MLWFSGYGEYDPCEMRAELRRRKAWQLHYENKGCTPGKAETVAREKCRRKATWPPTL